MPSRLLCALIAALLSLPTLAADAPAPAASAPAALPAPAPASAAEAGIPARCLVPGPDRNVNLACAQGYARRSEAEHRAGRDDAALAALGKADAFAPDDLRAATNRAGLGLSRQGPLTPQRLQDALKAAPDDVGVAMLHGAMSLETKKFDDAIADASHVIALRPGAAAAWELRATARFAKNEIAPATSDVSRALELDPKAADALRLRSSLVTLGGDYAGALADLERARRLQPRAQDPFMIGGTQFLDRQFEASAASMAVPTPPAPDGLYWLLWRYLALARRGGLEPARGSLGPGSPPGVPVPWPSPVIDFYLGRIDGAALLDAARTAQTASDQSQVCEAHFYLGEDALLRFRRDDAQALFRTALAECPQNFHEYAGAQAELKAMSPQAAAPVAASPASTPVPSLAPATASAPASAAAH